MKKLILTIIVMIMQCALFAQATQLQLKSNLQKYWYYRNRLTNFVKVSNDGISARTEQGTNIPIEVINLKTDSLFFDDGNGALNNYISVLATEYRLLKNYNQDYSQTIQQLYYALLTFNRLDSTAETYFQKDADLNGFFVRKDFTQPFWIKYRKNGSYNNGKGYFCVNKTVNSNLLDPNSPHSLNLHTNSEDNCYHMIEALALVNSLVDNEIVDGAERNFKQIAKDITDRIVGNMYHSSSKLFGNICSKKGLVCFNVFSKWYLTNPVTNELIYQGNGITDTLGGFDGTMLFLSHGFACAANNILQQNRYEGLGEQPAFLTKPLIPVPLPSSNNLFNLLLEAPLSTGLLLEYFHYYLGCPGPLTYPSDKICLTGMDYYHVLTQNTSDCPGKVEITKWHDAIKVFELKHIKKGLQQITQSLDDYRSRSLCATGNLSLPNKNPYQILIEKQNQDSLFRYEHLPLLWSVINNDVSNLSETDKSFIINLLNIAPACGPHGFNRGSSDFVYQWSSDNRLIWPESKGDTTSAEFNGLDYMLLHNLYWLTNPTNIPKDINPLLLCTDPYHNHQATATNDIVSSQLMNLTNNTLNIYAGNSITLQPGFETTGTGNVYFDISEVTTNNEPIYFHKISLSGYDACPDRLK